MSYDAVRKDYVKHTLEEADCLDDPIKMLDHWLKEALKESLDANAMTLSTVDANGKPSSRLVLIRGLDERGIQFYSNYSSQKAEDMASNPAVCVNFFWPWLERQVRIEGTVEKLSGKESDTYFNGRPRASKIGAWASDQSETMTSRDQLAKRMQEFEHRFDGKEVPRPDYWGGYLIRPTQFEFWQGRASRLHDRIQYLPNDTGWAFKRLFP